MLLPSADVPWEVHVVHRVEEQPNFGTYVELLCAGKERRRQQAIAPSGFQVKLVVAAFRG